MRRRSIVPTTKNATGNVYHGVDAEIFDVPRATSLSDLLNKVAAVYQGCHLRNFPALGERFMLIRWKRIEGIDVALTAMRQNQTAKNAAMRDAVGGLFAAMKNAREPQLPPDVERAIAATAELIALGRTPVIRERDDEIDYSPEAEGATRLAQQFCQLARGSARLEGRAIVDLNDLAVVHRVAFDTLSPQRAAILRALAKGQRADGVDLPRTTRNRALEDLTLVGLLTPECKLTTEVRELFAVAGLLIM